MYTIVRLLDLTLRSYQEIASKGVTLLKDYSRDFSGDLMAKLPKQEAWVQSLVNYIPRATTKFACHN